MVVVKRSVTETMKSDLLAALRNCRTALIAFTMKAPINGPEYKAAETMRRSLDDMAGSLTGDREHFWEKVHSTPKDCFGQRDKSRPGDSSGPCPAIEREGASEV